VQSAIVASNSYCTDIYIEIFTDIEHFSAIFSSKCSKHISSIFQYLYWLAISDCSACVSCQCLNGTTQKPVFITFTNVKPVVRLKNRSDIKEFKGFNNTTNNKIPNPLDLFENFEDSSTVNKNNQV